MLKIAKLTPADQKNPIPLSLEGPEPESPAQDDTQDTPDSPMSPAVVIPKALVVYMTGDMGPFKCSNCCYFSEPNSCSVVEGEIDPEGCCNMYCPPNHDDLGSMNDDAEEVTEPDDNPDEEAAEEEPPTKE